ncbi:hypothetical protein [Stakelama tenebrarum]|uniref:Uncharacterized protein n=1 Tax=Stakelama tenebrarum TaxID=2711215 RepID=A0A6G6Y7K4_9SPHN|nr:hypothetical protein [Sphingosinithalassobacter tenebrarum]QIG80777.1 hypothetical protein G5C33_13930 [Sphingosinithalassobacter tenebrarum]
MNRDRRIVADQLNTEGRPAKRGTRIDLGMSLSVYSRTRDGTLVEIQDTGAPADPNNIGDPMIHLDTWPTEQ